jgi:hypothetical protein
VGAVGLSASTAAYSETPAPLGRPGGPGLWRTKGLKLPDYIENIATGILKGGEPDKSRAIALAVAAVRRWASGSGKVSPEVRAAAAKALAEWTALKASHSHSNQDGGAMTLTWNGQSLDLASIDLGGYLPPHVPAGSPTGGQFGTTSGSPSAAKPGKTPASPKAKAAAQAVAAATARKAALHAQAKKLRVQAAAISAQIAGINATIALQVKASAAAKAKPKASAAAKAAAAIKKAATTSAAATKAKTAAKKAKKPTLAQNRATVTGLHSRVHALLSQANALDAQANAIKLSNDEDSSPFLDLAFAEALADRVPPGRPEGGQFTPAVVQLTRHDTPAMAARAVNAMGPEQRAMVRASTLPPPGFQWQANDRLAEVASPG